MLNGALRQYTRLEIITEPSSKLQKSLSSLENVACSCIVVDELVALGSRCMEERRKAVEK